MRKIGFQTRLAIILLAAYALFWTWQTPGWLRGPLTQQEIEHHIGLMEKNLAMPAAENVFNVSMTPAGPKSRR